MAYCYLYHLGHTYDWGEPTPVEKKKEKKKEKVVEVDDPWGLGAVAGVTSRSGTESRSGVPERSLLD